MAIQQRYWDANVFIGYFNRKEEAWKKDLCESVLHAAESGRIIIVTSYITYVEVIKIKGENGIIIPRENEQKIRDFFEQEYIIPRIVDRQIAELAREIIWTHNMKTKDAIHAATAIKLKMRYLDTFDNDLLALNGKIGDPPITIAFPPLLGEQQEIEFLDEREKYADTECEEDESEEPE